MGSDTYDTMLRMASDDALEASARMALANMDHAGSVVSLVKADIKDGERGDLSILLFTPKVIRRERWDE